MADKQIIQYLPSYEKHKLAMLELDEVPPEVKREFWGLLTRHVELTFIPSPQVLKSYRRDVRQILRIWGWTCSDKRTMDDFFEEMQVEFLVNKILLPKSIHRGERELQATEIKRLESIESSEKEPSKGISAKVGKMFGRG